MSRVALTDPSEGVNGDGFDNAYFNLIVYSGDIITDTEKSLNYRVLSQLGTGTFGEVFEVELVQEGETENPHFAMKISKSLPVNITQARHEVDISKFVCIIPLLSKYDYFVLLFFIQMAQFFFTTNRQIIFGNKLKKLIIKNWIKHLK